MRFPRATLDAAHRHATNHREALMRSEVCGCFHCRRTFAATAIRDWLAPDNATALCPHCGTDAVLGSASGCPVDTPAFLDAMHRRWFG